MNKRPGPTIFSSRLRPHLDTAPLADLLATMRAAGRDILDLTEANPTRSGFCYDEAAILGAVSRPALLEYEPDPRGNLAARRAVCEYYRQHGRQVAPESVFLVASTSEAYGYVGKLLGDPGDEILVPQPSYPLFESLFALEALRPVPYLLRHQAGSGWEIDLEYLRNQVSTRTKAIVVVNPNNPTGSFLKAGELAGLNELCALFGLALIVDEVFLDYGRIPAVNHWGSVAGNQAVLTFVLSGLSKIACLPQMKLGWLQVSGPSPLYDQALDRLEHIADTYLSVGGAVQQAAATLLGLGPALQRQVLERLEESQAYLAVALAKRPDVCLLPREAGWYAVLQGRDESDDEERACRLLEKAAVYVHPGYFYDFPRAGFCVISLLTPPSVFREGVDRLLPLW
ncbi:MAG: hypothetical protein A2521_07415 [Deltaproteobacteria bacterium RIFOXYD12_FULL_57_12]|nr:MAG: hypothetical protein A2521_07415 [Deltaproteobacteria bacterium RIFOXYD12_FULL_57_12]